MKLTNAAISMLRKAYHAILMHNKVNEILTGGGTQP